MSSTGALRVCVIGAGAAGLCACRHLSGHDVNTFVPTVFEQTDNVGGTWVSINQGFLESIPGYDEDPETQYLRNRPPNQFLNFMKSCAELRKPFIM